LAKWPTVDPYCLQPIYDDWQKYTKEDKSLSALVTFLTILKDLTKVKNRIQM
jgi:hypothetical protein